METVLALGGIDAECVVIRRFFIFIRGAQDLMFVSARKPGVIQRKPVDTHFASLIPVT